MNHFEEEYKKRFTDANSLEGIDSDKIWEGIADSLPDADSKNIEKEKTRKNKYGFLFLLLLIPISVFVFQFFQSENFENQSSLSNETASFSNKKNAKSVIGKLQNQNLNIEDKKQEDDFVISQNQAENFASNDVKNNQAEIISNIHSNYSKIDFENKTSEGNDLSQQYNYKSNSVLKEEKKKNTISLNSSPTELFSDKILINKKDKLQNSKRFPLGVFKLESKKIFLLSEKEPLINLDIQPNFSLKKQRSQNLNIGIFGGGNMLWNRFQKNNQSPDFNKTLNDLHQGDVGYSFSLEIQWKVFQKYNLVSGVEYIDSRTEFNFVQTTDSVMYRDNNPNLDLINADATRTVKHHNRQQYISIPLMVGISKNYGKFGVGMNAGIGINFFVSQKGKSLNFQNEISAYKESANILPYKKQFISYQINPFINYQSTPNLAFQFRPVFKFQSHGNSDFYGLNHSSILSGVRLGVVFTP